MSIDDNKTDTLELWSVDRKNHYFIKDKTGNVPGLAPSTPVFMVEGPANGSGIEGNIAIKNLLHESNGNFVYLNDTINTINTNISNIADIAIADAKTYTDEQIAIESNIRATEDINLGNDITILKTKTTNQSYASGTTTFTGSLNCGVLTPSSITNYSSKAVADTLYGSLSDVQALQTKTQTISYTAPIGAGQPSTTTITGSINNTGGNITTGQAIISGAIIGNEIYTAINMITGGYLRAGWANSGLGVNNSGYNTEITATGDLDCSSSIQTGTCIMNGVSNVIQTGACSMNGVSGVIQGSTVQSTGPLISFENFRVQNGSGGPTVAQILSATGNFTCGTVGCGAITTSSTIDASGIVTIGSGQTRTIISTSGITTYQPPIIKYPTTANAYTFSTDYQSVGYKITGSQLFNNTANQLVYTLGLQLPYGVWGVSVDWRLTSNTIIAAGEHLGMMNCTSNNTSTGTFDEGGSWRFNNANNTWASGQIRNFNGSTIVQALGTILSTVGGVANVPVMPYFIGYRGIGIPAGDSVSVIISARAIRIA